MAGPPVRASREGVLVEVHVTPSARADSVSFDGGVLHVRTTEPADKGKANREVLRALKAIFGPCSIVRGQASRRKTVLVENMGLDGVSGVLGGLPGGRGK